MVAIADAGSAVDVSPKGDLPGFVQMLDRRTFVVPARPANTRLDNPENLIASSGIALIFVTCSVDETYRVRGRAEVRDEELRARVEVTGKRWGGRPLRRHQCARIVVSETAT